MGKNELLVHYAIPIEFTFVTPLAPPANLNLSFFSEFQVAPERTSVRFQLLKPPFLFCELCELDATQEAWPAKEESPA